MAGLKRFRYMYCGLETVKGTQVATTKGIRVTGEWEDLQTPTFVDEDVGILGGTDRTYIGSKGARIKWSGNATFEQFPIILSACVEDVVSGAADSGTGASGKIYQYDFPEDTLNDIKTYTLEYGDDLAADQEHTEYCFVEEFGLDITPKRPGEGEGAVQFNATWLGRDATQAAKTSLVEASARPTVESILSGKYSFYIDTSGGTFGTTQVTATLLKASLKCKTGVVALPNGDAQLYFVTHEFGPPDITLDLTMRHVANAEAQKDIWRAETPKLIQLKLVGTALQTAGGAYTYKTMKINLGGKWEKMKVASEGDINVIQGTFRARRVAAAKYAQIIVVSELASLP